MLVISIFTNTAIASPVLDTISVKDLNEQAQTTLQQIQAGGPFQYDRDGIVFYNIEKQLPNQPKGYYQEYTVPTPNVNNHGARRIVSGEVAEKTEYYYTENHYRTFWQILLNE